MPDSVKKIASLILKYWKQELEEDELNELLDWANHSPANRETFAQLTNPDFLVDHLRELTVLKQEMRDRIWSELEIRKTQSEKEYDLTGRRIRKFFSHPAWKWIATAVLLLAAGILIIRFTSRRLLSPATTATTAGGMNNEVAGGSLQSLAKGLIQFADGSLLDPGSMANGTVLQYGALKLLKEPGGIRFSTSGNPAPADSTLFTIFRTPVGGSYTIWLPDGTEVMLNAASSLRFPVVFTPHQRTVEASGELYFNVQKSMQRNIPFFVHTSCMNMEVLGTKFNVHVYPKEKLASATLEEGSLRVWKQVLNVNHKADGDVRVDVVLAPGQQAQISNHSGGVDMGGIRVENVNMQEVLSWKSGKFTFTAIDCETLLEQLSGWYDVEFVLTEKIPGCIFSGWFNRTDELKDILRSLENSGEVQFEWESNNKVIVRRKV